jgi:hypothetical protein
MNDEDYYLDDEDEGGIDNYEVEVPESEEESEEGDSSSSDDDIVEDGDINISPEQASNFTELEVKMMNYYDNIYKAAKDGDAKKDGESILKSAVAQVISCDPRNTSQVTIQKLTNDFTNSQGRSRMTRHFLQDGATNEISTEEDDIDDEKVNKLLVNYQSEIVSRFIEYLANRDLSKDSPVSVKRKQRQIPAFIIFLFSTGNAALISNCDTLPDVYKRQVSNAIKTLTEKRYALVEELAERYEKLGHKAIAKVVREEKFTFFDREPAQLKTIVKYAPIITDEDIKIYKTDIRPRYMNITNNITQEEASDLIQVCEDERKQIYRPMKNKTRFEAIQDVKAVFDEWKKENCDDSELADKILWKN